MTYLTMMQSVAKNAGIEVPTSITTSDPDHVLLGQFLNETGEEITRRVDWGVLRKIHTFTGTGASIDFTLPDDFDRLASGLNVVSGVNPVRGSLTPDEWLSLDPVQGTPRYYYMRGLRMSFYPYLKTDATARVQYQSKNWVSGDKAVLTATGDTVLVPEKLVESGAVWRWRRHVGKDFADHLAEFEAMLIDESRFDSGVRTP